jgi:predicted DNA-binding antitoxin AbrB/MazE fold protein
MTITAKYEDGVFKPLEDVTINEGTIVEVQIPSCAERLKAKSRSVRDFAFYGMWKDRTDIGDSGEYINQLRRNLRG